MDINEDLIKGKFLKEGKNRFICQVLIEEETIECYVPSASKLINYIKLKGKQVLLIKNKGKNTRTEYSLFAVKYYNKYIILNLNFANIMVEEFLQNNYSYNNLLREKKIEGYKSDFVLEVRNEILLIEAKGIISTSTEVFFPSVFSERAIKQLELLIKLMEEGYKVIYFYVALSPTVTRVIINPKDIKYASLLQKCIQNGMKIVGLRSCFTEEGIKIYNDMKIETSIM